MEVDAINQVADGRERGRRVTFDFNSPIFSAGVVSVEDRSKRAETVRPQLDERCEKRRECDGVLNVTDDEDMEDGEMGFDDGSAQVRNIRDPGQPTAKEHQEHMTTHRPYRSWCKFCVIGRGVNAPHKRSDAQDDLEGVPHVSMDHGFLGDGDSEDRVSPVIVIRERRHKMRWAMLVPRKGTEFPWIAKRAAKFIDQLGHNRVTLRSDNEPAIEALAREIAQARQDGSQTVPERPPVGESQSNGIIECAVGLSAGQARTLKAALEHRIGASVPPDARILCWLVEFAAYLMNRCDIGSDGKTRLQRLHGRRDNTPILEFGERILYMPAKPARGGKWEPRFHPGVFVTEQGLAIKTRSANIRRLPESERWDAGRILEMRATPWSQMAVTMRSTSKLERRDPLRRCPETQEKC